MQERRVHQPLPNNVWIDWGFLVMAVIFTFLFLHLNSAHLDDKLIHMHGSP